MNFVFAFLAGALTTLSPCVLPVLPFVTASSLSRNRLGPVFLTLGLLASFVGVSLLVSTSGLVLGIEPGIVRQISGAVLFLSGVLFFSQPAADWLATKLSGLTGRAASMAPLKAGGVLVSEFVSGLLLGIVWTPCSGPSLGAALGLAGQAASATQAALVLGTFGVGAMIPMLAFAYGARRLILTAKNNSRRINVVKKVFGSLIMISGFLIVFELDRRLEALLTGLLPDAWLDLVTRF
jgi:cytochrome c-type biogenesis protein